MVLNRKERHLFIVWELKWEIRVSPCLTLAGKVLIWGLVTLCISVNEESIVSIDFRVANNVNRVEWWLPGSGVMGEQEDVG